jgi:hypothetical protein
MNYEKLYFEKCKENIHLQIKIDNLCEKLKECMITVKKPLKITTKNIGERDEIKCVKELFNLNKNKKYEKLVNILGKESSQGIRLFNCETGKRIKKLDEITKTKNCFKADVCIYMKKSKTQYKVSIKSLNGARPSIMNHTHRNANVFKNKGVLFDHVPGLDSLVEEYIRKRNNETIKQDVKLQNLVSIKNTKIKKSIINFSIFYRYQKKY